jgi:hypothetical protein
VASKPRKSLENWEIALIKAMIAEKKWNDQDILAYFTRPTRSINHARIAAIRNGTKHTAIKVASSEELASFLVTWPDVDPSTGLSLRGDELLLKAREAMIAAVYVFNAAGDVPSRAVHRNDYHRLDLLAARLVQEARHRLPTHGERKRQESDR